MDRLRQLQTESVAGCFHRICWKAEIQICWSDWKGRRGCGLPASRSMTGVVRDEQKTETGAQKRREGGQGEVKDWNITQIHRWGEDKAVLAVSTGFSYTFYYQNCDVCECKNAKQS